MAATTTISPLVLLSARGIAPYLGARLNLGGIAGEHEGDITNPVLDAAGIIAGAEARQDRALDDDLGQRIGEDWL